MATATAGGAAAGGRSDRGVRPHTPTVLRWELRKLVSQKRTYIGLFIGMILPIIFVVVSNVRSSHHHGDSVFARELTQSGLATPILMLLFESLFFLPLIASLVAGDIVAAEDGNGTLKTILTRSVGRGQVFAAKVLAAFCYAALALFTASALATVAGVASWGFNRVVTLSGTSVSAPKALLLIVAADATYLIPLLTVVAIGVLLSTIARNSAGAVVGTIGIVIVLTIVARIPGLEGIQPYLLPEQFQAWQGLMRTPTDWAPIGHSAWVCALYGIPCLVAAYLVFLRRDVAGG
ncbi:MAG: ABC transporter permease [Solirubrobacteraceae bacterium]